MSGPLLVVGALAPPTPWREIIWGAAALVEVTALWHLRSRMTAIRYDAEHVVKRFGALILIALGETLVAIGTPLTGAEHVGWEQGLVVAAAFALVAALWWAYFHHGDRFILMRFKQVDAGTDVVRSILAYGHLVLVAGIILVAVGFHAAVDGPAGGARAGAVPPARLRDGAVPGRVRPHPVERLPSRLPLQVSRRPRGGRSGRRRRGAAGAGDGEPALGPRRRH